MNKGFKTCSSCKERKISSEHFEVSKTTGNRLNRCKECAEKADVKIEESDKLDKGVKITFNDGSVLECAWNNWEGCFYTT